MGCNALHVHAAVPSMPHPARKRMLSIYTSWLVRIEQSILANERELMPPLQRSAFTDGCDENAGNSTGNHRTVEQASFYSKHNSGHVFRSGTLTLWPQSVSLTAWNACWSPCSMRLRMNERCGRFHSDASRSCPVNGWNSYHRAEL